MDGVNEREPETDKSIQDRENSPAGAYDSSQLPHLLKIYYRSLFPFDKYFQWMRYDDADTFSHREFSFTLEDDVYVRYQSFDSQEALEKGIRKANPHKIDIGAIFSDKPNRHNSVHNFYAVRKELVFDIDMTDYDDVRTCCREAQICTKCWKFITIAIRVIDRALREDFGFKHLLWVYSGRRGVHCWVCDSEALSLSQEARVAIVEYLTLVKGGEQQVQKVKLPRSQPVHPSIRSALNIIEKYFFSLLEEQGFLDTPELWGKVLALVPTSVATALVTEWNDNPHQSSKIKWRRLAAEIKPVNMDEIRLQWSYPRLDVNVSKGINHLLKSPFCVHPKTGRICVPINVSTLDVFDPFHVPTVKQICEEYGSLETKKEEKNSTFAYNKTSLRPYMEYFNKQFLLPLVIANKRGNSFSKKGEHYFYTNLTLAMIIPICTHDVAKQESLDF